MGTIDEDFEKWYAPHGDPECHKDEQELAYAGGRLDERKRAVEKCKEVVCYLNGLVSLSESGGIVAPMAPDVRDSIKGGIRASKRCIAAIQGEDDAEST